MRTTVLASLTLGLTVACGGGAAVNPDAASIDATDAVTIDAVDAAPGPGVEQLPARAADAVCAALFRCCDEDLVTYFAPFAADERLAAFASRLPPQADLDEAGCRAVLREMYELVPFGDWVREAAAGRVDFLPGPADQCVADLAAAACGAPARAALYDSTCFAYAAPGGGAEQRRMFARTASAGAACGPIRDGIGAVFYGTCDPTRAFCCYQQAGVDGCQFPFAAGGATRPGVCQAVAATGESCSPSVPLQLCATGSDCDSATDRCRPGTTAPLANGQACADDSFNLLGECVDGWCDVLGSKRCEPRRDDGAACGGGEECRSGYCQSTCQPNPVCVPSGGPVDAGPPDAPIDAGVVDAAVDAPIDASIDAAAPDAAVDAASADGERCDTAIDLVAASTTSPLAGYARRVATSFGASNDYNPLTSAGLPPSCSVVYDARGKERVFAITLNPGDRLRLRAELADGRQVGMYLLDTCPEGSWPDFDGTGACGSNEYNVGFCGVASGCDPAVLDVRYPTSLGGSPTAPATFWVVVDQVGADTSPGFTLDWQRIAP